MYPPHDKRLKALARMGATVVLTPARRTPLWMQLAVGAAGILIAALLSVAIYLLVILSIAFSGLFTLLPATVLHAILR